MIAWMVFFWGAAMAEPATPDYVSILAAEAAYAAMQPSAAPTKPKVPRSECTTCNGTGRVRSGDGHEWSKCPDCEPDRGDVKTPKSDPQRYN